MHILDQQNWALLLIRLILGYTFFLHGSQKVLGLFGGPGLNGFINWASGYGISAFWAYSGAFAEFVGGILLLTGVASELGALMVGLVMLAAVFLVHWKNGFFIQNQGFEYTLNLALFALAVIIGGPGKFALCDLFKSVRKDLF